MKKLLFLFFGLILILSVFSSAEELSREQSSDDLKSKDRVGLNERDNEAAKLKSELGARRKANQDIKEKRQELERIKMFYKNVKDDQKSKKQELLQSRNKYRDCLNSETEECKSTVKGTKILAREHLINSVNLIISNLEQLKSNMQLSKDVTKDEIDEVTINIDEQIGKMQNARLKLEAIDENTSRDEIKDISSTVRQSWQEVKVYHNKLKFRFLGARLRTLIVKADIIGERVREKASAINSERMNLLIDDYNVELEKAKEQYNLGKNVWEKMLVPTQVDESTREAQQYLKAANNHLKSAREKLREIIKEFRNNKIQFSVETEEIVQ